MIGELVILYGTVFNVMLLNFAKTITGLYISTWRVVVSALISSVVSALLYPSLFAPILGFVLLIGFAFSFRVHRIVTQGSWVIVGTLLVGGLLTAVQPVLVGRSWLTYTVITVIAACMCLLLVKVNWHRKLQSVAQQPFVAMCDVRLFGELFTLRAFIDTANECIEPLSRQPVHFVSYEAVRQQLSVEFVTALEQWQEETPLDVSMFPIQFKKALRFVPITTIHNKTVVVPAFRMDYLTVHDKQFAGQYVVFTKQDTQFPQQANMILHVFVLTHK